MDKTKLEARMNAFFEGSTSIGEERELYDLFQSGDYPAELERCREMFAWFEQGTGRPEVRRRAERSRRGKLMGIGACAVAAVVAVAVCMAPVSGRLPRSGFIRAGGVISTERAALAAAAQRLEADFDRSEIRWAACEEHFDRIDAMCE